MRLCRVAVILFLMGFGALSQNPIPPPPGAEPEVKLPNGKSQRDEILKADYKKNLEDAATLEKLATEVRGDLEKDQQYVVSVKTLKRLDDMEKLVKSMRGRLKRF